MEQEAVFALREMRAEVAQERAAMQQLREQFEALQSKRRLRVLVCLPLAAPGAVGVSSMNGMPCVHTEEVNTAVLGAWPKTLQTHPRMCTRQLLAPLLFTTPHVQQILKG